MREKKIKKEKTTSYKFAISLTMFPFEIYFSIGENDKKFKKGIKKYLYKEDYKSLKKVDEEVFTFSSCINGRCTHNFKTGHTIVRIREYKTTKDIGTLAHEIKHAIDYIIWENIGIKPKLSNVEVFAYAIGYVTERVYEQIYKK